VSAYCTSKRVHLLLYDGLYAPVHCACDMLEETEFIPTLCQNRVGAWRLRLPDCGPDSILQYLVNDAEGVWMPYQRRKCMLTNGMNLQ